MLDNIKKLCNSLMTAFLIGSSLFFLISCAGAKESSAPGAGAANGGAAKEIELKFNGNNALSFVYEQLAMGPRTSKDAKQTALRDRLSSKLKALGFTVEIQPLKGASGMGAGVDFYNVIATMPCAQNQNLRIFGAHYDTIPVAPNDPDASKRMTPIAGANDGASGVAVLMELARVVAERKSELKHSIKLIFFDGEDFYTGTDNMFYGSRHYAASISAEEKAKIEYFILADMVGDSDLNIYQEINSLRKFPELTEKLFASAETLGLKGFHASPRHQIFDDHIPFIEAGIPSAVLIDFDYPYWHTVSDTGDKVSADSLAQCGKLFEYMIFEK
ncbi:MAG TPA: M20/M25/M40 family metallo-hydrolase [Candidatus Wallbacteria bacterium]|nr:MAG: Aminopeptidase YwaD precursor [bacterium ADurb.Bin243]HPG56535.1 M20/M25/M40 family metallo-hydrolase [Candidatus Wallbacteria bacterium]